MLRFPFCSLLVMIHCVLDSKVSTATGSDEPEWSSEAVQIGGSGAAVGFLGMWTGAMHERPDPLGECWYLTEPVLAVDGSWLVR